MNNPPNKDTAKSSATSYIVIKDVQVKDNETINLIRSLLEEFFTRPREKNWKVFLVALVSALGVVATILMSKHIDTLGRNNTNNIHQTNLEIQRLTDEKNKKIELMKSFNSAATHLRAIRYVTIEACSLGLRKTPEQKLAYIKMRKNAQEQLISTTFNMKQMFTDIPSIEDEAKKLPQFDDSIIDYCSSTQPDKRWQGLQFETKVLMDKSIAHSAKLILNAVDKLKSELKEK